MILDGHNDAVYRIWSGDSPRHVDLAAAAASGFAGGFFALYVTGDEPFALPPDPPFRLSLPPRIPFERAHRILEEQAAVLEAMDVRIVRTVEDVEPGRVNSIMHIEGADGLRSDLSDLDAWYERGLRSLGPVWSRPNAFAEGVPFAFPGSPDTGPGLTDAGRALVRACNFRGILVDTSHLNEKGFWDVARTTSAPIVATHSNAHALCASTRNLTDRQLDAIGASGGVVGINFAVSFLREDGRDDPDTPLTEIVRHIEYALDRIGPEHVAFGSDFDGANVPRELDGIRGLPRLVDAIRARGHSEETIDRITHGNWLRVLGETWRPWGRYFDAAGLDPRPTLVDAAARFAAPGLAVDLGPGTGRDTLELLRLGWSVIAIDREQDAIDRLVALAGGTGGRLEARVSRSEDAGWPAVELLNASYSLPFTRPDAFDLLWRRIVGSIRPGGRFAGQLFGERDEWAGSGIVTHTRDEVERLLGAFEVERLDEFEGAGTIVTGAAKHWHLFHIVARKR